MRGNTCVIPIVPKGRLTNTVCMRHRAAKVLMEFQIITIGDVVMNVNNAVPMYMTGIATIFMNE